jgi:hypothetical protein
MTGLAMLALPAAVLAAQPETFLTVEGPRAADTLRASVGKPVRLHLTLPGDAKWTEANIGRFVVRTHGVQQRIEPVPAAGTDAVEYTFADPGVAMIILAAGPPAEKNKSDAWERTTHCTKLFFRVDAGQGQGFSTGRDPGETAKIGTKIELRPLIAPTALRVGDHLPVRAYFNNAGQKDDTVQALRPDGSTEQKTTDSVGSTFFEITTPGKWIIRYEHTDDGTTYVGDVVFEVPTEAPIQGEER